MKEGIDYSKVHPGIMQLVIAEDRALGRGTYKSAGFYSEKPSEKDGPPGSELRAHFFLGSRNGTYADEDILTAMGEHTAAIIEQVATGVLRPPQNTKKKKKGNSVDIFDIETYNHFYV